MRISDWSSDVCSSDLHAIETARMPEKARLLLLERAAAAISSHMADLLRQSGGTLVPSEFIGSLDAAVHELSSASDRLLSAAARARFASLGATFVEAGAPAGLAAKDRRSTRLKTRN